MADKKTAFPMLPVAHWWRLRTRFKQSIPGTVTDNYLASVLDMQVRSARTNVLPYLVSFGIIDDEGKTLDRAKQWRDDALYSEVCEAIVSKVYPQELIDTVPDPSSDSAAAERWFANHTGAGQVGVRKMVAVYTLLKTADISKEPDGRSGGNNAATKKRAEKKAQPKKDDTEGKHQSSDGGGSRGSNPPQSPDININLQIHISSDATPDQIDKIFESMAKHIYRKG